MSESIYAEVQAKYPLGEVVYEGKTQIVRGVIDWPGLFHFELTDFVTGGDGKRKELLPTKGELSTVATCFTAARLQRMGHKMAFVQRYGPSSFIGRNCGMAPFEVVVRGVATGSYLSRHPDVTPGTPLMPQAEFFLKTNNQEWKGRHIGVDDPFVKFMPGRGVREVWLYHPREPRKHPLEVLPLGEVFEAEEALLLRIADMACRGFVDLRQLLLTQNTQLKDLKMEFGLDDDGILRWADLIDMDSLRAEGPNGEDLSKDPFRRNHPVEEMLLRYQQYAEITERFLEHR